MADRPTKRNYDVATDPPHWMRRREAASYARVTAQTIDRARQVGALVGSRLGGTGRYRYRRADLDRWLGGGAHLRVVAGGAQ